MKVVILGAGQVGGSLSANLSSNGFDVTVIDSNDEKLSDLDSRLDLRTVSGHASHPITLKRAGCDSGTILLALTNNDEVNIVSCQIAKETFSVKKTICRLSDSSYLDSFESFKDSIDIPISPEKDITEHLSQLIRHPGTNQIETFAALLLQELYQQL